MTSTSVKVETTESLSGPMVDLKKISKKEKEIGMQITTVTNKMKKFDADVDQLENVVNEKPDSPKK